VTRFVLAAALVVAAVAPNAEASFRGRNGRILFVRAVPAAPGSCRDVQGNCDPIAFTEIWDVRPNGSHLRRLTTGHRDGSPRYTRDGRRIVFVREGGAWMMRADGSHLRRIDVPPGVFSPSLRRVAFRRRRGIVSVRTRDGKGELVLFSERRLDSRAIEGMAWSVRDVLAFALDCRGLIGIWRASSRRHVARRLVRGGCYPSDLWPAWSPAGRRLAFARVYASTSYVWVKRLHRRPRRLTGGPYDVAPVWSPDGRSLAFTRNRHPLGPARTTRDYDGVIRVARLGRSSSSLGVTGLLADWQPRP
jgi:hypothetical protein